MTMKPTPEQLSFWVAKVGDAKATLLFSQSAFTSRIGDADFVHRVEGWASWLGSPLEATGGAD